MDASGQLGRGGTNAPGVVGGELQARLPQNMTRAGSSSSNLEQVYSSGSSSALQQQQQNLAIGRTATTILPTAAAA
ncbi:MAG: hypothetical protein ACT6T3_22400, partial [Agrobacterium sp.]|uniref:hypothetical protein n=1 Tax=Agrobacterium sp. TaxID=361 RepID=UPI00403476F1